MEGEQGRSWSGGEPRRPEPYDALIALPEHAGALRPEVAAWEGRGFMGGADVLAVWDGRAVPARRPSAPSVLELVAGRLRRIPHTYQPWQDLRPYRSAMVAVAALSRLGPLPPKVRAAVEHALSLDRRLSEEVDYRAVLDDERLRDMLQRALQGEAVHMPALSRPSPSFA